MGLKDPDEFLASLTVRLAKLVRFVSFLVSGEESIGCVVRYSSHSYGGDHFKSEKETRR